MKKVKQGVRGLVGDGDIEVGVLCGVLRAGPTDKMIFGVET